MTIRIIRNLAELTGSIAAWNGILEEMGNTNPYITPDWITNWWKFFGAGKELYIIVLLKRGVPVGFCPLMMTQKRSHSDVRFIGTPQAGRMNLVVRRGFEKEFIQQVLDHLLSLRGSVLCSFRGMNQQDENYQLIREALVSRRCFIKTLPSSVITFSATTRDAFFKEKHSHHTIRKTASREKALNKLSPLTFEPVEPKDMETVFSMHEKRWSRKIDQNGFGRGTLKEFFTWLMQKGLSGAWDVSVWLLKSGRNPIGFAYGIQCNGRFTFYRIAHDDDYAFFKPGMIVVKKVIEECFNRGYQKLDFSTGDEPYKKYWTDETEWIDSIEFGTDTLVINALILAHRLEYSFVQFLKQKEALAHFKRVTAGRIRYSITGAMVRTSLERVRRRMDQQGLAGLWVGCTNSLAARLTGSEICTYAVQRPFTALKGSSVALHTVPFDEAAELSGLLSMDASKIVERYYQGSRCQILLRGDAVIGYAWLAESEVKAGNKTLWQPVRKDDRCIYDICVFKQCGKAEVCDALACLAGQSLPRNSKGIDLLLPLTDRRLGAAAELLFHRKEVSKAPITRLPQPGDNLPETAQKQDVG